MIKLQFLIILLFIYHTRQGELIVTPNATHILYMKRAKVETYQVHHDEETSIFNYPDHSTTMGIELNQIGGKMDNLCTVVQRDIAFEDYRGNEIPIIPVISLNQTRSTSDFSQDPHRNDPGYFLSNPILVNMVNTKEGIAAVTSDHRLITMNITQDVHSRSGYVVNHQGEYNFTFLRPTVNEHTTPQIVYDPITDQIYLIYQQQIIHGQFSNIVSNKLVSFTLTNVSTVEGGLQNDRLYVGNVRISDGFMFVPVGNDGLDLYKIQENGELMFTSTIDSFALYGEKRPIFVIDVAIGGDQGQNVYILDRHNGVTMFILTDQLVRNVEFGLIPVKYGTIIKEYNNANLFILCQKGRDSYVDEIGINILNNQWFKLRSHYLSGRYFDIVVTDKFAILRGVDAHRIIYHSIWDGFQSTFKETWYDTLENENIEKLDEEYLFIPKLQSFAFFSSKYGFGDPASWHYNQTHPFLLGMTTHNLVELRFIQQQPYVRCKAQYRWQVGQAYKYSLLVNTTSCKEKTKDLLNQIALYGAIQNENLVMCVEINEFVVKVTAGRQKFSSEELFSIVIGLTLMLVVLAIILAYVYKRFRSQKQELTSEISGFENKGYVVDVSKHESQQQQL